ncbi:hypothetical protein ACHAWF_011342 [Thalassiosira exigua]
MLALSSASSRSGSMSRV